jgi:hypothetical protein
MKHVAGAALKVDARLTVSIEKAQLDPLRDIRKNREVRTVPIERRTKGARIPKPTLIPPHHSSLPRARRLDQARHRGDEARVSAPRTFADRSRPRSGQSISSVTAERTGTGIDSRDNRGSL